MDRDACDRIHWPPAEPSVDVPASTSSEAAGTSPTQCAAVTIVVASRTIPPQNWAWYVLAVPAHSKPTCHGVDSIGVVLPPTIRSPAWAGATEPKVAVTRTAIRVN